MLINLRNALLSGKRKPYQCELEYIEGTGTQYIDTGVAFSKLYTFKLRARLTPTVNERDLFGAYLQTATNKMVCGCYTRFIFGFNPPGARIDSATLGTSELDVDIVYAFSSAGRTLTVNGTTYSATGAYTNGLNVTLFRANPGYDGAFKCYSFQIYDTDGTTLVQDLIPVFDWDGNAKMFDRVTQSYPEHYGTFVAGPEIWPVEYLQSDGNAYIDTGVNLQSTLDYEIGWQIGDFQSGSGTANISTMRIGVAAGAVPNLAQVNLAPTVPTINYWGCSSSAAYIDNAVDKYKTRFVKSAVKGSNVIIDDVVAATFTRQTISASDKSFYLFLRNNNGTAQTNTVLNRIDHAKLWFADNIVRDYKPIRVGSGSTWEGAMLDEVNRKVYRNQGTGAFLYGNDLKYPIPSV